MLARLAIVTAAATTGLSFDSCEQAPPVTAIRELCVQASESAQGQSCGDRICVPEEPLVISSIADGRGAILCDDCYGEIRSSELPGWTSTDIRFEGRLPEKLNTGYREPYPDGSIWLPRFSGTITLQERWDGKLETQSVRAAVASAEFMVELATQSTDGRNLDLVRYVALPNELTLDEEDGLLHIRLKALIVQAALLRSPEGEFRFCAWGNPGSAEPEFRRIEVTVPLHGS